MIFVSYKREDASRVGPIVDALRMEGFEVWWDHGIGAGSQWRETILEKLEAATVVVVLWSELSVSSKWVLEEADFAQERGKLCPVMLDNVSPPIGFRGVQATRLDGWNGKRGDPSWRYLTEFLEARIDGSVLPERRAPKSRRWHWPTLAAVAVLVTSGFAIFLGLEVLGVTQWVLRPVGSVRLGVDEPSSVERERWNEARASRQREKIVDYLVAYPRGAFAPEAQAQLASCKFLTQEDWTNQAMDVEVSEMVSLPNRRLDLDLPVFAHAPTEAQVCDIAKKFLREKETAPFFEKFSSWEHRLKSEAAGDGKYSLLYNAEQHQLAKGLPLTSAIEFNTKPTSQNLSGTCSCEPLINGARIDGYTCVATGTIGVSWRENRPRQVEVCG